MHGTLNFKKEKKLGTFAADFQVCGPAAPFPVLSFPFLGCSGRCDEGSQPEGELHINTQIPSRPDA